MVVLIFNHVYRFWQKNTLDKLVTMATRKRLFFIFEIEILLIPSYEKSPNLVVIDSKLKKLSTGKQNLRGKHLPPVLIGLRRLRSDLLNPKFRSQKSALL